MQWLKRCSTAAVLVLAVYSIASADCLGDFNLLVHGNMNVGPYSVTSKIFTADASGELHEVANIFWQVTPPDAAHSQVTSTANSIPYQITVVKNKAWTIEPGATSWSEKPPGYAQNLLDEIRKEGFLFSQNPKDVHCLGVIKSDNKDYITFNYQNITNQESRSSTVIFDAETNLPTTLTEEGEVYGRRLVVGNKFIFDPSIKIEPPTL